MKLKVCGLTQRTNLKKLQELSLDYTGFIFYDKSSRCIKDPSTLVLPRTIENVAVFVDPTLEEVFQVVNELQFKFVQLHGNESIELCKHLKREGLKVIKAFGVNDEFDFRSTEPYAEYVDFFLFDTKGPLPGGNGYSFQWTKLEEYGGNTPFFLSGGIGPADADEILKIKHERLFAIDVNSKFEIEPGVKDLDKLRLFMERLTNEK